jgi:hypothetical protein
VEKQVEVNLEKQIKTTTHMQTHNPTLKPCNNTLSTRLRDHVNLLNTQYNMSHWNLLNEFSKSPLFSLLFMLNLETVLFTVLDCATFDGFESVELFGFSFTEFLPFEGCVCFDLN